MAMDIENSIPDTDVWDDLELDEGTKAVAPEVDAEDKNGKVLSDTELDSLPDIDFAEETPAEPVEEKKPTAPAPLSKAEKAVIAWKRAEAATRAKLKESEEALQRYKDAERIALTAKKLEDEGYDADTAKRIAASETERETTKSMLEDMRFLTANAAVLARYPEASNELPRVREAMKTTGKSVAEVCAFLYNSDNAFEAKARADALATSRVVRSSAAGAAVTSSVTPTESGLTARQEQHKQEFERMLGKKLSGEEYKRIMSRAQGRRAQSFDIE